MCVFLLTLAGLVAAMRLPVTLFPHIDYPRVVVSIDAGERDAEQMAADLTRPSEIALRRGPGGRQIRSTTTRGSAQFALTSGWGCGMGPAPPSTPGPAASLLPAVSRGSR